MILPWHTTQWQQCSHFIQTKRVPHALLLTGMAGMGKRQFAESITRALLCTQSTPTSYYCGSCQACQMITENVHPNILQITPAEPGHAIKVDQIRQINEFVQQTSLHAGHRFIWIYPAQEMNINAANALLKTLEEPAAGAVMILISDQALRLPATILSRCQRIHFSRPKQAAVLPWLKQQVSDAKLPLSLLLKLAQGAPFAAHRLAVDQGLAERQMIFESLYALKLQQTDLFSVTAKIQQIDLMVFLDWVGNWITDLIRLQLGAGVQHILNEDYVTQLMALKPSIQVQSSLSLITYLQQLRKQIAAGINLNKMLMIESVLIRWLE